ALGEREVPQDRRLGRDHGGGEIVDSRTLRQERQQRLVDDQAREADQSEADQAARRLELHRNARAPRERRCASALHLALGLAAGVAVGVLSKTLPFSASIRRSTPIQLSHAAPTVSANTAMEPASQ